MHTIMRSGHMRHLPRSNKVIYVTPTRVRNTGARGKGPKLIGTLKKGKLRGYSPFASLLSRHRSLIKALQNGKVAVMRRLRAIATLTKRTIPRASRVYLRNRQWVAKNH